MTEVSWKLKVISFQDYVSVIMTYCVWCRP